MAMRAYRVIGLIGLMSYLLLVQGCREEEQDRVLFHEKGTYQGPDDEPLDEEQVGDLRERARIQSF